MILNILDFYQNKPEPLECVLPGLKPGIVGSIVAPGGQGKSMLAIMLAHYIASGADMLGLGDIKKGGVSYISAEDGNDVLHERFHAVGKRLTQDQINDCVKNLTLIDLTQDMPDLLDKDEDKAKKWEEFFERAAAGRKIMFVDTLRVVHGGDENDGGEMSELIKIFKNIASKTKCSIIFLHHTSKSLAMNGQVDMQQASRGSSVLTDNIRWQAYVSGMSQKEAEKYGIDNEERKYFLRFGLSKQNYGEIQSERWFRRVKGGLFEPITGFNEEATTKRINKNREARNEAAY